jgi:hypothetical protein
MAGSGLTLDDPAAARAVAAIVRHAAAQRHGVVSLGADGSGLVLSSPGETSLLMARLSVEGSPKIPEATYAPPGDAPRVADDASSVKLRSVRGALEIACGKVSVTLDRMADSPVDVAWVWPAAEAAVEAVVSRDALLDALPAGEGRLTFSGADKQIVLQAGREERRLPLKNRTRRRKDIGTAVSFDDLRPLVEATAGDVTIGLADLRPLTVESGPVRGMVVRGAPMRWRPASTSAERPATGAAPKRRARTPAGGGTAAGERRRLDAERHAREQEQEARRRTRSANAAVAAVGRALSQLDAAADDAGQLGDDRARERLDEARTALQAAEASLRRHLDS